MLPNPLLPSTAVTPPMGQEEPPAAIRVLTVEVPQMEPPTILAAVPIVVRSSKERAKMPVAG